jgi:hypothetical protein
LQNGNFGWFTIRALVTPLPQTDGTLGLRIDSPALRSVGGLNCGESVVVDRNAFDKYLLALRRK